MKGWYRILNGNWGLELTVVQLECSDKGEVTANPDTAFVRSIYMTKKIIQDKFGS